MTYPFVHPPKPAMSIIYLVFNLYVLFWFGREVEALYGHLVIGSAVVVGSSVVRGALTAINWIKPTRVPQVFTTTRMDALAHCLSWLEQEAVTVPSELRAYRMQLEHSPNARPLGVR